MFREAGPNDIRQLLTFSKSLHAVTGWMIRNGMLLSQYSLARNQLYE